MACFRVTTTELDGRILTEKYFDLRADTVEDALRCKEVNDLKTQAKKDGLCFRVTKEG